MKKLQAMMLLSAVIALTACGSTETAVVKTTAASEAQSESAVSTGENIEAKENLLSVEFTVPKSFFGEETPTQDSLDQTAKEKGIDKISLNEDGSATYKMSKSVHKQMLAEMKKSVEDSCNEMINGENAVESYQKITFNDDMTVFSVYVDKAKFNDFDTISALALYISGSYYQLFNCVPNETIDVQVDFIDQATEEILNTGKLSDMQGSAAQPGEITDEKDMLNAMSGWYVGIWNHFVNFQSFRATGKDCTGSDIDIDFAYSEFKKEYAEKEKYEESLSKLSDDYSSIKDTWSKMKEQIEIIYTDLEANGVKEGGEYINLDLLDQYSSSFSEDINNLN